VDTDFVFIAVALSNLLSCFTRKSTYINHVISLLLNDKSEQMMKEYNFLNATLSIYLRHGLLDGNLL